MLKECDILINLVAKPETTGKQPPAGDDKEDKKDVVERKFDRSDAEAAIQ
jgi:hypothetical protein